MPKVLTETELAEREANLIQAGLKLLEEEGFSQLTMDRLVARVPYSKGTVYNTFSGKEDLLLAMNNRGAGRMLDLLERGDAFRGSPRERYLAVVFAYSLYGRLYPTLFLCDVECRGPEVFEKASEKRRAEGEKLMGRMFEVCRSLADAEAAGDLSFAPGMSLEDCLRGTWYVEFGCIAPYVQSIQSGREPDFDLDRELMLHMGVYLDGLGWKPLTKDFDYAKSWKRFGPEIFKKEMRLLKK